MKTRHVTIGLAGLVATFGLAATAVPVPGVAANPCTAISPATLTAYAQLIGEAHRWASADAGKNGTTGRYAVAARNSRDQLKQAQDRVLGGVADLRKSDPSVTSAGEAGTIKEHLLFVLRLVPEAAHWAIISEIYHDSPDARRAFEGSVNVLKRGHELYAESGRCYMDGL